MSKEVWVIYIILIFLPEFEHFISDSVSEILIRILERYNFFCCKTGNVPKLFRHDLIAAITEGQHLLHTMTSLFLATETCSLGASENQFLNTDTIPRKIEIWGSWAIFFYYWFLTFVSLSSTWKKLNLNRCCSVFGRHIAINFMSFRCQQSSLKDFTYLRKFEHVFDILIPKKFYEWTREKIVSLSPFFVCQWRKLRIF